MAAEATWIHPGRCGHRAGRAVDSRGAGDSHRRVRHAQKVPIAVDILVHASFALWFVLRPDVLPGWAVVSIVLQRSNGAAC